MEINNIFETPDFLHDYGNGILLNEKEVNILKQYDINACNYNNVKSLMYDIETILENENIEELDQILMELSERNYYMNTHK